MNDRSLDSVYVPLKIAYGLVPLLAGLDKFVGLLADWQSYLAPSLVAMLPFSAKTFMMIVGVIEVTVGLAILTKLTRLGAYVAMGWLALIAVNLLLAGVPDVAVRDLTMAVGAYSLGTLAGLKGLEWLPGSAHRAGELKAHASTR
jgi:uncharacterized membrane protein